MEREARWREATGATDEVDAEDEDDGDDPTASILLREAARILADHIDSTEPWLAVRTPVEADGDTVDEDARFSIEGDR